MNQTKSMAMRTGRRMRRRFNKHTKGVKVIAMSLAIIMAFSALSANVDSIFRLLTAYAADGDVYPADLTLFDYYSDDWMAGEDAKSYFHVFNRALYDSGYAEKAGTFDSSISYFPLYLGLQYYTQSGNNPMKDDPNTYRYSLRANSDAGGGAALGLVDHTRYGDLITQGDGKVVLPYFDEGFVTQSVSNAINDSSFSKYSYLPLGEVKKGQTFNFIKQGDVYTYDSSRQYLSYANNTFNISNADSGAFYSFKDDKDGKTGFYPWDYVNETAHEHGGSRTKSQNYGYGAKFSIKFSMSSTGTLLNDDGTEKKVGGVVVPIKFNFSGDDDVWVFIDDTLVLDVGGAHGEVAGEIDFSGANGKVTTKKAKKERADENKSFYLTNTNVDSTGELSYALNSDKALGAAKFNELRSDATKEHVLTVYYLERGTLESNCKISFNFQIHDSISVRSRYSMNNVNDWFKTETKKVAEKEGVRYRVQSNGGTLTGLTSPDAGAGKSIDSELTKTTKYTIVCVDNTYGCGFTQSGYSAGDRVKLPDGSNKRAGYYISGWKLNGSGSYTGYTVNADDADADGVITFTEPIWTQVTGSPTTPSVNATLVTPNAPTYLYVNSSVAVNTFQNSSNYPAVNLGSNKYFVNLTGDGDIKNYYISNNDNKQHPGSSNDGYTLNGNKTGVNYTGTNNHINNLANGYLYNWYSFSTSPYRSYIDGYAMTGDSTTVGNNIKTVTGATGANSTDNSLSRFIAAHASMYDALMTAHANLETRLDNGETLGSDKATYVEAIETYHKAKYDASKIDEFVQQAADFVTALGNIKDTSYESTYSYSDDTMEFYVYATSQPTVTATNYSGYGLSAPTITVSSAFASESALPSGAPSDYSYINYYKVTMPSSIVEKSYEQGHSGEEAYLKATKEIGIAVSVNGTSTGKTTSTISDMVSVSKDHPCYYVDEGWRDITDEAATYEYSTSTKKIFWVYNESVTAPTVTYSGSVDGHDLATSGALTPIYNDVKYYYGYQVPAYAYKKVAGSIQATEKVTLNITTVNNGSSISENGVALDDNIINDKPYCYYLGCSNLNKGWYQLVTICFNSYAKGQYVYAWYNNTDFPTSSDTSSTTRLEMTEYSSNYYYYMPSVSGIKFKNHNGGSSWSDEYTLQTQNYFYSDSRAIASNNSDYFYQFTATYKINNPPSSGGAVPMQPPVSGGNNGVGQFVNNNTSSYENANGVNFKLFDSSADDLSSTQSVIRQTDKDDGGFYILFDQTAKFTSQFERKKGLRIAQTGDSFLYNSTESLITVNPDTSDDTVGTVKGQAADKKGMYNRYSTTWSLQDDVSGAVAANGNAYNLYLNSNVGYSGSVSTDFASTTYSNNAAIYFDNIAATAAADKGIHLTATFDNEVITGNLTIEKKLTDEAKLQIAAQGSEYNPEFLFWVRFGKIFGGDSAEETYTGQYYYMDSSGKYITSSGTASSNKSDAQVKTMTSKSCTVGGTTTNYYVASLDYKKIDKGYVIVIEGIPVETEYTITEVTPVASGAEPTFSVSGAKGYDVKNASETVSVNGVVSNEVDLSSATSDALAIKALLGDAVTESTGAIATYYNLFSTNAADYKVVVTNDTGAYIILKKTIDKAYYFTKKDETETDNPADLAKIPYTVGGKASDEDKDYNGYQAATDAEQSFIFDIVEYKDNGSGSLVATGKSFQEVLSFKEGGTKTAVIKVDPTKYYKVSERSDWSWKYRQQTPTVTNTKDTDKVNTIADNVVTVHEFKTESDINIHGAKQPRTDTVTFTNKRAPSSDNATVNNTIEGDTSVKNNVITKKAS